ncbi:MBL fold metallo-hydrolase [Arachidicoccus sp.]|uniref:MBL fold metallo-hydrolase n=1 Tax=Arachidicoccus sp. TaxID=1872624 RepID=UPI003D21C78B
MKLYTIDTELFRLDGGAMFGVVPKALWNKLLPADENNMCELAMRCLLIKDEERLILIDTGIGNKQDEKFLSRYLLHGSNTLDKSLAKHGYSKEDITDVFLTHLHFDHVGGAVEKSGKLLAPTFKNAVYWSNKSHWNWAKEPNARESASFLKENILPLQESKQLQFIDIPKNHELISFTDNISIRFVSGHTKDMMLPQIRYKNRTVVFVADLIPTAAHLLTPYIASYDMFPLQTIQEKTIFLEEALAKDYILFFEHDAQVECCTLCKNEKGKVVVKDSFTTADII